MRAPLESVSGCTSTYEYVAHEGLRIGHSYASRLLSSKSTYKWVAEYVRTNSTVNAIFLNRAE